MRPVHQKSQRNSYSCNDIQKRFSECSWELRSVSAELMDELEDGRNRFETNPDPIRNVCEILSTCLFKGISSSVNEWLEEANACSAVAPQLVGLAQFCGQKIPFFLSLREQRSSYANAFLASYNEPVCDYKKWIVGMDESSTSIHQTNVYIIITCIVLLVNFTIN